MTIWPFPDRPGVPLNPDRDGWHWVNGTPREWVVFDDGPSWRLAGSDYRPHEWAHRIYQGPCLTPEEAAALQARADRNAAEYARVDDKARLAEFLHKQEIAVKDARILELRQIIRYVAGCEHATASDEDLLEQVAAAICRMNGVDPTSHISINGSAYDWAWKHFLPQARAALGGKDE